MSDAGARDAIRNDLASTFVVEAAAGTGKTTEMIARILAVIRTGASTLERIVAVTFTEKAAGEMKLRLRTELERARRTASGDERARFERSLKHLEVARIGSIHSFCADLLRERPIEAEVDPLFEVAAEDDAERIYTQAFDAWFQRTVAAPGEGVRRLLRRNEPTDQLRRAGWSLVDRRDFAGTWRRDPFDRDAAIDGVLRELAAFAGLAERAGSASDPLAILATKLARWLAELDRRERVRPRDHDGLEAELATVARWWEWKLTGRAKLYGADLMRADVVTQRDAAKAELQRMLEAADADLAALLHDELRPLVDDYERDKARGGRLDFLDLLAKTRDLLRGDRRVREELQLQLSHFFVDEFQDTDPLQVEILLLLCADDPVVDDPRTIQVQAGKLFVVGDPKQAIYRFRRADIALYEAVKQRLVAGGAKLVQLTTSFRSVPQIQSAVNAAFEPVMRGDGQAHYVPLEISRAEHPSQPAVIALPVPRPYGKRDVTGFAIEESYPDAVAAFVEHLTKESRWTVSERGSDERTQISERHVCLMFRRFQSFGRDLTRPYVRALEARGIPHVLVGGRSFHEREEIEAVRNALRAIEWPDDELSVYGTLRGPLFAFHDEDLVAFIHTKRRLHPLHALVAPVPEVAAFRDITDALATLGSLHLARNRRPIADTIARLLSATRAHAGIAMWPAGEQALANIFRVMDLARRFEAAGATSFRAFVDRLGDDADRGRQPDAPVVEEGTEGVRIMTVHAAKGLEFPVVILCDPTAPLGQERPSRHIDVERRVWLEPLAGCIPIELRERKQEVLQRDREEGQRLAYVAVTRARDLLVVPVVGDEERPSWLEPLAPVIHPHASTKRSPGAAPGCPPFGDDSVIARSRDSERVPTDSVAPGLHVPRAGTHGVVWWDPAALGLDRELGGGLRQRQILQADESHQVSTAGELAHAAWQARHGAALGSGAVPSLVVYSVTEVARTAREAHGVKYEHTDIDRAARPNGRRFGSLVHAILAAIDFHGDDVHVHRVAANQARLLGASDDEIASAVVAVRAALGHPLLVRAAASLAVRRETSVAVNTRNGLVEGIVDLAFLDGEHWTVVDFKTDVELGDSRARYEMQVRLYADAIAAATGLPSTPVLFTV